MRTSRRSFLTEALWSMGLLASGSSISCQCNERKVGTGTGARQRAPVPGVKSALLEVGRLEAPDEHGVRLPRGFRSRVIARTGEPVGPKGFRWHAAPDGGAVFSAPDGGHVYVSNCETKDGGASAVRFDKNGEVTDAYSILTGTRDNCAGGPTPWGTWLSCEEHTRGQVWECDPFGQKPAEVRPALGTFEHEAVTVDPKRGRLYLTEDVRDGRLYRFTPTKMVDGRPDLSAGTLHVMRVMQGREGKVSWLPIEDGDATKRPTRHQARLSTAFDGGEGIWWHRGIVYFTTKGDHRVWALDTEADELSLLYDARRTDRARLTGVDNVTVTPAGDVLVAEDQGDMQLVAISHDGGVRPLLQLVGHDDSEITGPALDPSGTRLYFSSQRGTEGRNGAGMTFEVTGPFTSSA